MSQTKRLYVVAALLALAAAERPANGAADSESFLKTVDFVVVGEVSYAAFADASYSMILVVHRSLKGDLKPGAVVPVADKSKGYRLAGREGLRGQFGLWFLTRNKGELTLMPPGGRAEVIDFAYYPVPRLGPELPGQLDESPLVDKVFVELARAVESPEPIEIFRHLASGVLSFAGDPVSQVARDAFDRWSRSASPDLVTLGLTALVGKENSAALARSLGFLATVRDSRIPAMFTGSVSAYRNPEPEGIRALGEMATEEAGIPGLRSSAAYSLRSIHTRESLPYLAKLLDSQDAELLGDAVTGFTFFVNNFPVMTPEVVRSMSWSKPVASAAYRTPETARYSSPGRFENAGDAEPYVQFWKSWWAQNKAKLGFF